MTRPQTPRRIVFVVQDLDLQRHGVGKARTWPDTTATAPNSPMARALQRGRRRGAPSGYSATSRSETSEAPAPRVRAASSSAVPCSCISGMNSRAMNGNVTKMVARTMPGNAKMISIPCALSQGPRSPGPEKDDIDQARDHRRHGKGQVDERDEHGLAAELELRDGP